MPSRLIADILSYLAVYEPANGGADLRASLACTSMRRRFGGDITGKLMSELFPPEDFRTHIEDARLSLAAGKPTIVDSRLSCGAVEQMHLEGVILPVFAPDLVTKWALVGVFYFN